MKPLLSLCLLLSCMTACITSSQGVQHPSHPKDDTAYWPIHEQATLSFEVVRNFETRYQVQVTHLSPAFRAAAAERYRAIFNEQKGVFETAADSVGFFVSIYSAQNNLADLQNQDLWNIVLQVNEGSLRPTKIQTVEPKELWSAFFPTINPWSREFLILFALPPLPSTEGGGPRLTLSLNSPNGSVRASF